MSLKPPYQIIEVANTHAGSLDYIKDLLAQFSEFDKNFGIKFQVLKPDRIALSDFSYYGVYEEIYFDPKQWNEIINLAAQTKDVWLDLFDTYSIEILSEHLDKIKGIKLQASVLYNYDIIRGLKSLDISDKLLMINIAGFEIDEIKEIVTRLNTEIAPKDFVIQFGFQNYPTELNDAGLSKIDSLKEAFPDYDLCFADHLDGESDEALVIPLVAALKGCNYIEKHVLFDGRETKFDKPSSVTYNNYKTLVNRIENYISAMGEEFINEREKAYLDKTRQIPVLKTDLRAGDQISLEYDLEFKRTDQEGITVDELLELQNQYHILAVDKKAGSTILKSDLRLGKKATIIACRMKSTRLPQKAILPIGGLPSIQLCLKRLLTFENVDMTVLATSTVDEDAILEEHTYSPDVKFHQGHPEDVIQRYLDAVDKFDIDVIMRVTGDCPYHSKDIHRILMQSHFESGADYTSAPDAPIGMNVEIINANVLRKIKEYFPVADYSEYMTYYITNNPDHFNINYVDLPESYKSIHRMTMDYQEDYEMFNAIEDHFKENNIEYTIDELLKFLDTHPNVAKMNEKWTQVYLSNNELIERINKATTIVTADQKS